MILLLIIICVYVAAITALAVDDALSHSAVKPIERAVYDLIALLCPPAAWVLLRMGWLDMRRQAATPTACRRCGQPFDPTDTRFDGHAQHYDTPWCRACIDNCDEGGIGHRCAICVPGYPSSVRLPAPNPYAAFCANDDPIEHLEVADDEL